MLHKEEENRQKGLIVSFVVHALLLLLCLIPYMTYEDPPKQLSGITVAFGSPDGGAGDVAPTTEETVEPQESKPTESSSANNNQESKAPEKQNEVAQPKKAAVPISDVTPLQDESVVAAEEAQKQKAEADAQAAAEAEVIKRQAERLAAQEAQRKAEEEAKKAALDKSKSTFSDLFGQGSGNNNSTGNQGDPNGDPNSSALDQIATGSGRIGGGLSNRGVVFEPEINDSSQKTGKVVIKVCVDSSGKVVEADYTQRGSTTTDKYLVDVATKAAMKYQFTPSDVETQCGSITIEFKVK